MFGSFLIDFGLTLHPLFIEFSLHRGAVAWTQLWCIYQALHEFIAGRISLHNAGPTLSRPSETFLKSLVTRMQRRMNTRMYRDSLFG